MVAPTKTIQRLSCLRCGHEWWPIVDRPKQCPRCRTRSWNSPRRKEARS